MTIKHKNLKIVFTFIIYINVMYKMKHIVLLRGERGYTIVNWYF